MTRRANRGRGAHKSRLFPVSATSKLDLHAPRGLFAPCGAGADPPLSGGEGGGGGGTRPEKNSPPQAHSAAPSTHRPARCLATRPPATVVTAPVTPSRTAITRSAWFPVSATTSRSPAGSNATPSGRRSRASAADVASA